MGHFDKQHDHQGKGHEQQRYGKQGIYLADELVNGKHGGDDVIDKDHHHPEHGSTVNAFEYFSRTIDEYCAYHNHQQHREDKREGSGFLSQIFPHKRGKAGTVVAYGKHTRQIVVHSTGKYAAKHYP